MRDVKRVYAELTCGASSERRNAAQRSGGKLMFRGGGPR